VVVKTKASKLETLGAWLGLWTPPRDVEVPPVPWRKVAWGALGLAIVVAAVALFVAPAIDDAKDEGAAERQRALDQRAAERRARIEREQAPQTGRVRTAGSRAAVVAQVELAIGADAVKRFSPKAEVAQCEPAQGQSDLVETAPKVAFDCLSSTVDIRGAANQTGARGQLGFPYRAIVDFAAATYAFCRMHPAPSEKALPDPRKAVRLPAPCLLQR
jgi:hypothetical protein